MTSSGEFIKTPLKKVVNVTPAIVIELEAMGHHTLEDLQKLGWEKLCLSYSKIHTARFTPEFFILLFALVENIPLKKVTKEQVRKIQKVYKKAKASSEAGFAKKSKKNS